MGQLRTANKRRNRALAAQVATKSAAAAPAAKPAPVKKAKPANA